MIKEDVVDLMLESFNNDTLAMCKQANMAEAQIKTQMEQSQPSLAYMLSNLYDKLKENNLIA
jgi:hypothetical protein